jgi:hypothetical protein
MEIILAMRQLADFIFASWEKGRLDSAAGVFRTKADGKGDEVQATISDFLKRPGSGILSYIDENRKTNFKYLGQFLKALQMKLSETLVPLPFESLGNQHEINQEYFTKRFARMPCYERFLIARLTDIFWLVAENDPQLSVFNEIDTINRLSAAVPGLFFQFSNVGAVKELQKMMPWLLTMFGGEGETSPQEKQALQGSLALVSDRIGAMEKKADSLVIKGYASDAKALREVAQKLRFVMGEYSKQSTAPSASKRCAEDLHYIYLAAKRHPTLFRHREAKEAVINVLVALFSLGLYPLYNKLRYSVCFPKEKLVKTKTEGCVRAVNVAFSKL